MDYIFPKKYFEFEKNDYIYRFFPLFKVEFYKINTPLYHTFDDVLGKKPNRYRILLHKYPNLQIRVVEPTERENIKKFMSKRIKKGKDWYYDKNAKSSFDKRSNKK